MIGYKPTSELMRFVRQAQRDIDDANILGVTCNKIADMATQKRESEFREAGLNIRKDRITGNDVLIIMQCLCENDDKIKHRKRNIICQNQKT